MTVSSPVSNAPSDLVEPVFTENSQRVLKKRYLLPDETVREGLWRVANAVAQGSAPYCGIRGESFADGYSHTSVEGVARAYYTMMAEARFLPNSPTLMNAGKDNGLQLSACFVLPVEDDMDGIFETCKRAALIHKSGGGTGFSFSRLRQSGSLVGSTHGVASGPVSFMTAFNAATETVKQGGTRRGANMGILRVDHPDIEQFINCKRQLTEDKLRVWKFVQHLLSEGEREELHRRLVESQIANFNISVAMTDAFFTALEADSDYALVDPRTGEVVRMESATRIWDMMCDAAWETGDPGMVFIDRINAGRSNPVPSFGPVESTNPCGEQPLYANEACNLGSINLAKFVRPGMNIETKDDHQSLMDCIDLTALGYTTRMAVRFLDDVITVNPYPDAHIDRAVKSNRRIGLGVMGWADMLVALRVAYASDTAAHLADFVMGFIERTAHDEDRILAEERGAFPTWRESIYNPEHERAEADAGPRRNSTVTTIAPTGTISIIAGCSSGIEPLFALAFKRTGQLDGQLVDEFYEPLREASTRWGWWDSDVAQYVLDNGHLPEFNGSKRAVPVRDRNVFAIAHEVPPEWHIRMQAAFQAHLDNAVSKTINLEHTATTDDVRRAYELAYSLGCMGITVYRDGSKVGVLHAGQASGTKVDEARGGESPLDTLLSQVVPASAGVQGGTGQAAADHGAVGGVGEPRPDPPDAVDRGMTTRPAMMDGSTYSVETPLGTAYITINHDTRGVAREVFVTQGKAGSDIAPLSEAIGKLTSMLLRLPSPTPSSDRLSEVARRLRGIGGSGSTGFGASRTRSLPDALAQVIETYLQYHPEPATAAPAPTRALLPVAGGSEPRLSGELCPDCQCALVGEEGCSKCYACGFSKC